jgi:hypothetical protein
MRPIRPRTGRTPPSRSPSEPSDRAESSKNPSKKFLDTGCYRTAQAGLASTSQSTWTGVLHHDGIGVQPCVGRLVVVTPAAQDEPIRHEAWDHTCTAVLSRVRGQRIGSNRVSTSLCVADSTSDPDPARATGYRPEFNQTRKRSNSSGGEMP